MTRDGDGGGRVAVAPACDAHGMAKSESEGQVGWVTLCELSVARRHLGIRVAVCFSDSTEAGGPAGDVLRTCCRQARKRE